MEDGLTDASERGSQQDQISVRFSRKESMDGPEERLENQERTAEEETTGTEWDPFLGQQETTM